MFLEVEEVREIIEKIVAGVVAAQRKDVKCGYPTSFTVTKLVGVNTVTVTYPIEQNPFENFEDYKDK